MTKPLQTATAGVRSPSENNKMASKGRTDGENSATIADALRELIPAEEFDSWVKPLHFIEENDRVIIKCPTSFIKDWVFDHYADLLDQITGFKEILYDVSIVDINVADRVRKNGGYQGDTNLTTATQKAMADKEKADTNYFLKQEEQRQSASKGGKAKTTFNGTKFLHVSTKTLNDLDAFLINKPRPLNAFRAFNYIVSHMEWQEFKCPYAPIDIARTLGIDKSDMIKALRQIEEFGVIKLVKRGRTNEIWLNPYHAYHGLLANGKQTSFVGSYQKAVKQEAENAQEKLALEA